MPKIQMGKHYCTREGRAVRIYATDGGNGDWVHGAIRDGHKWVMRVWSAEGKCVLAGVHEHKHDLVEVRPGGKVA